MNILTSSDNETRDFARKLAEKYKKTDVVIALSGSLGAGKTTFAQGFAQGLGIKDKIISPTFVLIRQHKIPGTNKTFYHIDLYRLEADTEISKLGISEILNGDDVTVVEWADKIKDQLPKKKTLFISIEKVSEFERKLKISEPPKD